MAGNRAESWATVCRACGSTFAVEEFRWRCRCGGLLDVSAPAAATSLGTASVVDDDWSLWRYRSVLPPLAVAGALSVTMGEGMTPLVAEGDVLLKLDYLQPTLSFKDRGAAVLVGAMAAAGVRSVVADSSGNAGAALAAYTARAGISAEVFVPASTPAGKRGAIAASGATVRVVDGDRIATAMAARRRVEQDRGAGCGASSRHRVYASHVHQPLFTQGTKTCAYELWEQLGRRPPGAVVVAAGNGSMVLGLRLGFDELHRAGLMEESPAIYAVQAQRCAPLARLAPDGPTCAEGIAIADPPRAVQITRAIAGTPVLLASEEAIAAAQRSLGRRGFDVEPTAAAAWAGWFGQAAPPDDLQGPVVIILGGAGAKGRRSP